MKKKLNIPKASLPRRNQRIEFRYFVVGFFDLLGQREYLSRMEPIPSTKEQKLNFERKANASFGAVYEFRKLFNEYFANYMKVSPPDFVSKLPAEERKRVLQTTEIEMNFQGFSDTLIMYFSAMNRHHRYQWRVIHALLAACATLVPTLLSVSIPVRGGIDLGVGCEFVPGEIYGPVLQSAYYLESHVAKYPRIVFGSTFANLIHSRLSNPDEHDGRGINGELYDKHAYWIGKDIDGIYIVDYLGRSASKMLGSYTEGIIKKAHSFICQEYECFCRERNEKLAKRYKMFKRYFEARH